MRLSSAAFAVVVLAASALATPASAAAPRIGTATPTLETPTIPDNARSSDADDPAIWVAPGGSADSLVVTAVKNGGIRVYDLKGKLRQTIDPIETAEGAGRINNVDVAYGLKLRDGRKIDVAVASDRGLDVIRIYRIDRDAQQPLTEITAKNAKRAFPKRPKADGKGLEANPLDDQNTVYGLATWTLGGPGGPIFAIGTQRGQPRLGVFQLTPQGDGRVAANYLYDYLVPATHRGQDLRQENDDPRRDWSPQFEGLAVDQRSAVLYAGQEDVGIWRINLLAGGDGRPELFYETRGSSESTFNNPSSVISRDVEGLCIYYGENGGGYLIASSQGGAHGDNPAPDAPYDDTFAAFELNGRKLPTLVGSFQVGAKGGIDGVQESDGADVLSFRLPGFESGLFITQDGYDGDNFSGEPAATNFKFVKWETIARSFSPPLKITPQAYNPRRP